MRLDDQVPRTESSRTNGVELNQGTNEGMVLLTRCRQNRKNRADERGMSSLRLELDLLPPPCR